jgi:hypothetical protein
VIASGNHLLTQVKGNQKKLRRRLELGAAGRTPSGVVSSETKGRNRWETRKLSVFPAKAWFMGAADQSRSAPGAHGLSAQSGDRALQADDGDRLLGFFARRPDAGVLERVDQGPLAHRERQSLRARYRFRRGRLTHPQESRHRRAPALLRL